MPTLSVVNFNIVCATLGGFITVFGLVSYLLKEKFYLSEALISTLAGVVFSPHATNFIKPLQYANGNSVDLETITLYFSRLVLGVQLVLAGVQLPSKYLWDERKSLSILLGPGMCIMWIVTSLLVWGLVPSISILEALAVGACVTPTDPVLSNSIVKGKFADKNIPRPLQKVIIAESGANDGLGYPFLFLALYLLKYVQDGGAGESGGRAKAIGYWFGETWGYTILLSIIYGAVVGWIAKDLLHWAEERHYVDRESFLVFAITLALFIVGTVGMIGSDDVLACFVAGNAFTWDDWFRKETMDDSLQPTIDMLLNVTIFMWYGAVCPWHSFVDNSVVPIYRLIPLAILVLLLRRLPMVLLFRKKIYQIDDIRRAIFTGFFGPIGVSAVFYIYVSREFLRSITVDGVQRQDAEHLSEVINVVVWFLVICSIFVHGLCIPVGKLGLYLPRTLSNALSFEASTSSRAPRRARSRPRSRGRDSRDASRPQTGRRYEQPTSTAESEQASDKRTFYGILSRLSAILSPKAPPVDATRSPTAESSNSHEDHDRDSYAEEKGKDRRQSISAPMNGRVIGRPTISVSNPHINLTTDQARQSDVPSSPVTMPEPALAHLQSNLAPSNMSHPDFTNDRLVTMSGSNPVSQRRIRFPDEQGGASPIFSRSDESREDV